MFYDDPILSGTKTAIVANLHGYMFYDDSILSGTKTHIQLQIFYHMFYDDSILSGTKTQQEGLSQRCSFMMTQFFQVLKQSL